MMKLRLSVLALVLVLLSACTSSKVGGKSQITVAAAANLTEVFDEMGRAFTAKTGIQVVFSFGSTAQLAKQIENGAPFDLFAAADVEHVDTLVAAKKLTAESRAIYALGQLALWIPKGEASGVRDIKDLITPEVRFLAVAKPELAPYGQAAVDALRQAGIWETVQPKIVYGGNISQAKQLVASGNADAGFTAYSLVLHEQGTVLKVDRRAYKKIEQALGVLSDTMHRSEVERFRKFVLGSEGQAILSRGGYLLP